MWATTPANHTNNAARKMTVGKLTEDLAMARYVINSLFLYVACTQAGYVKVGISRSPFDRVYQIHCGSPSPVRAVQWTWIGSIKQAMEIEQRIKLEWINRHTRGEWYLFDYSKPEDKADFHDTLHAVVEVVTGSPPNWERLRPERVDALISAGVARWNGKKVADRKKRAA